MRSSAAPDRFLTIVEVCEQLGISDRTFRRWRAAGLLQAIKLGGVVRIRQSELERALSGGGEANAADAEA